MCSCWQSLSGKRRSRQGRTVHYGRTPIVAVGTTDMHSMTQQHQDGARNKVVQFLGSEKTGSHSASEKSVCGCLRICSLCGQGSASSVKSRFGMPMKRRLTEDGRLNARYVLPELTPRYVGQLLMFLMFSIAYEGELADVDAFDQPGVETYKRLMKAAPGTAIKGKQISRFTNLFPFPALRKVKKSNIIKTI